MSIKSYILTLFCIINYTLMNAQNITIVPLADVRKDSIPVEMEHYTQATTTGAITKITSNIPTDRGRTGLTQIWNTANSDQGNLTVNYPSGYGYAVGTTTYSNATLHANAWWALGTSTYNSYPGNASQPNVPTIHFTSVNNSNTDNNMSWAGTETYYDSTVSDDVFRIRYEGSYKYNVTGINTKIDLYFFKSDWTKCYVVLRTYTADGSNIEQIALSNGSSWLASKVNGFASGECYQLTSSATIAQWVNQGTKYTDTTGYVSFSNPNTLQYRFTMTSPYYQIDTLESQKYFMSKILQPDSVIGFDYYCLDLSNNDTITNKDLLLFYFAVYYNSLPVGAFFNSIEYNNIVNSTTSKKSTYQATSIRTIQNLNPSVTQSHTIYMPVITKPPKSYKPVNTLD